MGEVALSVVLLSGTGLLVRTLLAMKQVDAGFDPQGLGGIEVNLAERNYPDPGSRAAVVDAVLAEVRAVPGVAMATIASAMPPDFSFLTAPIETEGRPAPPDEERRVSSYNGVRPEYFRLVGMPILQGVEFAPNPAIQSGGWTTEVIINTSLARQLWPGEEPLGRKLRFGISPWLTVVGVVPDVPLPGATGEYGRSREAQIYEAMSRAPTHFAVVFRSERPFAAVAAEIENAIRGAAPLTTLQAVSSADSRYAGWRGSHRAVMRDRRLSSARAAAGADRTARGHRVFGEPAQPRVRRAPRAGRARRERRAHGDPARGAARRHRAGDRSGRRGGGRQGGRHAAYGVSPADPLTMAAVAAVLLGATLLAVWLPARRAASNDPVDVLRLD